MKLKQNSKNRVIYGIFCLLEKIPTALKNNNYYAKTTTRSVIVADFLFVLTIYIPEWLFYEIELKSTVVSEPVEAFFIHFFFSFSKCCSAKTNL